jgi:superfamily I DNA/RNA helicase
MRRSLGGRTRLADRGVQASIATHEAGGAADTVHVMTLHRLKGLEYRCVAVAGMTEGVMLPATVLQAAGDDPQARSPGSYSLGIMIHSAR